MGCYLHRIRGTALGIVTTAEIEDATPAANAVFTSNRGNGTGICDQYLDQSDAGDARQFGSGLRVLLRGGRRWFLRFSESLSSRAADSTGLDQAVAKDPKRLLGLFAYGNMNVALDKVSAPAASAPATPRPATRSCRTTSRRTSRCSTR